MKSLYKKLAIILLLFVSLGAIGCDKISKWAIDKLDYSAEGDEFLQVSIPDSSDAIIYIYRPARVSDFPYSPTISINGEKVVEIESNGYTWVSLRKGHHNLKSGDVFAVDTSLSVEQGKKYYAKYDYDWFHSKFILLEEKPALREISRCKFLAPEKNFFEPKEVEPKPMDWFLELAKSVLNLALKVIWWFIHFITYVIAAIITFFLFPANLELSMQNFLMRVNESMTMLQRYEPYIVLGIILAVFIGGGGIDLSGLIQKHSESNEKLTDVDNKLQEIIWALEKVVDELQKRE